MNYKNKFVGGDKRKSAPRAPKTLVTPLLRLNCIDPALPLNWVYIAEITLYSARAAVFSLSLSCYSKLTVSLDRHSFQWCEQDQRCRRLQLTDLLISPLQHCTKFPLLLNNIRHYTEDVEEQKMLTESLVKLEASLSKSSQQHLTVSLSLSQTQPHASAF